MSASSRRSSSSVKGMIYRPIPQNGSDEETDNNESIATLMRSTSATNNSHEGDFVFIITDREREENMRDSGKRIGSFSCKTFCLVAILSLLFCIIIALILLSLYGSFNLTSSTASIQSTTSIQSTASTATHNPQRYSSHSLDHPTDSIQITSSPPTPSPLPFTDWRYEIKGGKTELSPHIIDINSDGEPDIILNNITNEYQFDQICPPTHSNSTPIVDDVCLINEGHTPCQVRLLGLSGRDGSVVWSRWVAQAPFASNCREDLNEDGRNDCLFSGRVGAFVAMDTHRDNLLWVIDRNITCPSFNYYYPLYLPDLDGDGIKDILLIHGGDSNYEPLERSRSPGVLVVVSGRTGRQISERIHTPDQKESYSSPVLYSIHHSPSPSSSDIEVILFGTGGETVTGSLWAITLHSLSLHVSSYLQDHKHDNYTINTQYIHPSCYSNDELLSLRPRSRKGLYDAKRKEAWLEECPRWSVRIKPVWNVYRLCVYEVYSSDQDSGVLVPPVIVDINSDGRNDLIVSVFNGHTLLFDGLSLSFEWDHYVPDTQSYSIPAPIYFNDDNVLDLVLRINKGNWPDYDYSLIAVLDGRGGVEGRRRVGGGRGEGGEPAPYLWTLNCTGASMSSAVVLRHRERGHDSFMFIGEGCSTNTRQRRQTKKREKMNTCTVFRRDSCHVHDRRERHGEEEEKKEEEEEGDDTLLDKIPEVTHFYSTVLNLTGYIPTDIWSTHNASDSYPDPDTDTETFITKYCGLDYQRMTTGAYFLTPKLIKEGEDIKPLLTFRPYVYKTNPHNSRTRRHPFLRPSMSDIIKSTKNSLSDRKAVRCSHIIAPLYSPATLAISDINGDESPEGIVTILYSAIDGPLAIPQLVNALHPPKIVVETFNIKGKVEEVYGSDAAAGIHFENYYSREEQPWGQYMGNHGNNVYYNPKNP